MTLFIKDCYMNGRNNMKIKFNIFKQILFYELVK